MNNPLKGLHVFVVEEKFVGSIFVNVHTFLSFDENKAKEDAWQFVEKMRKENYDSNGNVHYTAPKKSELHLEEK